MVKCSLLGSLKRNTILPHPPLSSPLMLFCSSPPTAVSSSSEDETGHCELCHMPVHTKVFLSENFTLVTCLTNYFLMKKIMLKCSVNWVGKFPLVKSRAEAEGGQGLSSIGDLSVSQVLPHPEQRSPCHVPGQTEAFPSLPEKHWCWITLEHTLALRLAGVEGKAICWLHGWWTTTSSSMYCTMQAVGSAAWSGTIFKSLPNVKTFASCHQIKQRLDKVDLEAQCLTVQSWVVTPHQDSRHCGSPAKAACYLVALLQPLPQRHCCNNGLAVKTLGAANCLCKTTVMSQWKYFKHFLSFMWLFLHKAVFWWSGVWLW